MWSFWEQQTFIGQPDFVIVGSGIVGLSAAIHLKKILPKKHVLVIEGGHLPSGASTKNAGFACFGSPSELLMDLKNATPKEVFSLVKRRYDGLTTLREMLGDENMAYEAPGSFELFQNESELKIVLESLDFLNKKAKGVLGLEPYHAHQEVIKKFDFRHFSGGIEIKGEGQINTGKMMQKLIALARSLGVEIINGLLVSDVLEEKKAVRIITPAGQLSADQCLIATNGFAKKLLPDLDIKPARAQVLITAPVPNLIVKGTFHFDEGYYYFRNIGNRLLFGGGRNMDFKTEETTVIALNQQIQDRLEEILRTSILPNQKFEIEKRWAGIMGLGTEKKPILEKVNSRVTCAVRLGGMGIAIGTLIGKEAAGIMTQ